MLLVVNLSTLQNLQINSFDLLKKMMIQKRIWFSQFNKNQWQKGHEHGFNEDWEGGNFQLKVDIPQFNGLGIKKFYNWITEIDRLLIMLKPEQRGESGSGLPVERNDFSLVGACSI